MAQMTKRVGYPLIWMLASIGFVAAAGTAEQDPCAAFSWNVEHERARFATAPEAAVAGLEASKAPPVAVNRLYELALRPQSQVTFALPPEKQQPAEGAFGGLARLTLDKAGNYRVSVDQALWIDLAGAGKFIASSDFQGRPDCSAPHKIVQYVLAEGQELVLQLSGGKVARMRLTITRMDGVPNT